MIPNTGYTCRRHGSAGSLQTYEKKPTHHSNKYGGSDSPDVVGPAILIELEDAHAEVEERVLLPLQRARLQIPLVLPRQRLTGSRPTGTGPLERLKLRLLVPGHLIDLLARECTDRRGLLDISDRVIVFLVCLFLLAETLSVDETAVRAVGVAKKDRVRAAGFGSHRALEDVTRGENDDLQRSRMSVESDGVSDEKEANLVRFLDRAEPVRDCDGRSSS
jgi:hypothetical protein